MSEIFSLYKFKNPLYIRPNLKLIFTYQNGLESKKLFSKMFLKLNSTSNYIFCKTPDAPFSQELHRAQPLNDVILTPHLEKIRRSVKAPSPLKGNDATLTPKWTL